jgi:hypothetical protein
MSRNLVTGGGTGATSPRAPTAAARPAPRHRTSKLRRRPTVRRPTAPRPTPPHLREPRLLELRLRTNVPPAFAWAGFLTEHPALTIVAMNRHPADARDVVAEMLIRGGDGRDWSAELRATRSIVSVQELSHIGRPQVYRIRWTPPPFYIALLHRFDLVGALPMVLHQGTATLSLALTKSRLRELLRELRRRGFDPEVLELRPLRGDPGRGGLTPTQRVRFETAIEAGFYDVPRRVSLDELARRFSVRKSAFAESLALARRKLLVAAGRVLTSGDEAARAAVFGIP